MKLTKTSAFTLMEILLATTIFAGAMILAAGAFSGGIKSQIKAVRERKIAQEARLFEETFARKIREATGEGTYQETPGTEVKVKGVIAVKTNNYKPKVRGQPADIIILFKPTGAEILKVIEETADGRSIYKIKSKQLTTNEIQRVDIEGSKTFNQTLFPQESYLFLGKPFMVTSDFVDDYYQNSLVTLTGQVSTNPTQCVNNNRDACMNIETKVSSREGIKL